MDNNKKLVVLIILIIVTIFVWIPRGRRAQKEARPFFEGPTMTPAQTRKRSEFTDWGRNPFAWPGEDEDTLSALRLTGIVWDEQTPYAIINGSVLHTGDKINSKTVKLIEQDKVILTDGLNDVSLELK